MRVILFYDRFLPHFGGVEQYIANLVQHLPFNFKVITPRYPADRERELLEGCDVHRFSPAVRKPVSWLGMVRELVAEVVRARRSRAFLRSSSFDVFHPHAPCHSYNLFRLERKWLGRFFFSRLLLLSSERPTVRTIHHLYFGQLDYDFERVPFLKGYFHRLITSADEIIAVENYSYDYLLSYIRRHDLPQVVHKVHNAVDIDRFSPIRRPARKSVQVFYMGRLTSEKGADDLLWLIPRLPPGVELVIAGSGSNAELVPFREAARDHARVTLLEHISDEEKVRCFRSADVVYNPVRFEAITIITLEALACGTPVIMLNRGDRYPVDEKTGFLVKGVEELPDLLSGLVRRKSSLRKMGSAARRRIVAEFSNEAVLPRIEAVYQGLKKRRNNI